MVNIKVNCQCKKFRKEDKSVKKTIINSLEGLIAKINTTGTDINQIFNNDSIIYDRINGQLFIYKSHNKNNMQLRLVCHYKKQEHDQILYLIDYIVKKQNNKKYIRELNNKFKNVKIEQLCFEEPEV